MLCHLRFSQYVFTAYSLIQCAFVFRNVAEGANILVYLPTNGRSHFKPFQPLFVELANRGHNVTVVGAFPPDRPTANYHHLQVGPNFRLTSVTAKDMKNQTRLENYIHLHSTVQNFSANMANEPHTLNLLRNADENFEFDLIMTELYHFDTFFALGARFQAPIVGISFQPLQPIYNWITGNPWSFSYVPHLYLPYSDRMDFVQRFANAAFGCFTILYYHFVSLPTYQRQIDFLTKSSTPDIPPPSIREVTRNLSLVFVESHFSADYVRPYLPNIIDVAGIHIPPINNLPEDIENFINQTDGFVYVSLGTLIDPNSINHLGDKFARILENIPYRVLWKWNPALLSAMPRNSLVKQWLPQADLLRHPKCKLFISHGGYHSVVETINGGVPILCLPFFTDQYHNAKIVEQLGIGETANVDSHPEHLIATINQLLVDSKYREKAHQQSVIFRDRPIKPLDLAVYWIEYVIRHKGAPHLKSAASQLHWYQYLLLDVLLTALIIVIFVYYALKKIVKLGCELFSSFVRRKKIKKQ